MQATTKRKWMATALVVLVLVFTGCMTITVHQKIEPDGMSHVEMTVDMSKLAAIAESFKEMEGFSNTSAPSTSDYTTSEFPDFCENLTNLNHTQEQKLEEKNITNLECSSQDYVITVSFDKQLTEKDGWEVKDKWFTRTYEYNTSRAEEQTEEAFPWTNTWTQNLSTSPITEEQPYSPQVNAELLRLTGFSFNYTVQMPGSIQKAPGGKILQGGDSAVFDLLEMMGEEEKEIYVESAEVKWLPIILLFIGFTALILIIAAVLISLVNKRLESRLGAAQGKTKRMKRIKEKGEKEK